MTRYHDYEDQVPCQPGAHKWAPNGYCSSCRHSREQLERQPDGVKKVSTDRFAKIEHYLRGQGYEANVAHQDGQAVVFVIGGRLKEEHRAEVSRMLRQEEEA